MRWIVPLILIGWPVVEIAVFLHVGDAIGFLYTILLFLAAGAVGLVLLRMEGLSLLIRTQKQLNEGIVPVREGFDGLCLVTAGVLLILPGFVTDILALLLLLPPVRAAIRQFIVRHVEVRARAERTEPGRVIEGDYEDATPDDRREAGRPSDTIVHRRD